VQPVAPSSPQPAKPAKPADDETEQFNRDIEAKRQAADIGPKTISLADQLAATGLTVREIKLAQPVNGKAPKIAAK
jgi:hypothetical protein